ncbi:MAG TPA: hypothetical protein VFU81_22815 [Thermomicrobiales bacterium]|nr:hypothetical protein [Thermomicrobiales bacterium]
MQRERATAEQARSQARRLLIGDGIVAFVVGLLTALFASWLGDAVVVVPPDVIVAIGALSAILGAALALTARRAPVRRRLLSTVVAFNVACVVAIGLLLGVAGGQMPDHGRWLLTAVAVVAGTFAALEWMVPRRHLPGREGRA